MSKNSIYMILIIAALLVISMVMFPKKSTDMPVAVTNPTALPSNGLVSPPPATATAPARATAPTSPEPALPTPAPKDKAMDADDVPAGAEVAPVPSPGAQKPADGLAIPPSEGQ